MLMELKRDINADEGWMIGLLKSLTEIVACVQQLRKLA